MRIKDTPIIKRANGFFYWKGKVVPAIRPGSGYGVALHLERSQIDEDFGLSLQEGILFLSAQQIREILALLDKSDELTFEMLKHAWKGERPFKLKLEHFMYKET